jgi:transcription termination factor NusB
MEPEMEEDGENFTIDPELWLQTLLTINSNKERRDKMIQSMSVKSGIPIERVEGITQALLKELLALTGRAN